MATGKLIGYIRVSSFDQNPERQLDGKKLDKVFLDKVSGKDMNRPQLKALREYAREGDTIMVHSMDRLARDLDDLRELVNEFTAQHITVQFVKEGLTFTGEDSPMSRLLLSVMGACAEFERAHLKERQREGIAIAKKKGIYKGRKKILSIDQVKHLHERIKNGDKKAHIAKDLQITRETLYQYLKNAS